LKQLTRNSDWQVDLNSSKYRGKKSVGFRANGLSVVTTVKKKAN